MAQYTQRTQPMHRHSKWFEQTFQDTEISSNCQIVCEEHMNPMFVRNLKQRHYDFTNDDDTEADKRSDLTKPDSSSETNLPQKRKVGRPKKYVDFELNQQHPPTKRKRTKKHAAKKSVDQAPKQTIAETEKFEGTALNEPPEKSEQLETSLLQDAGCDNDSITYEIIIKDDPDNFEDEILPSVFCDSVDVKIKRKNSDITEPMDYEPEEDQPVVDVKVETTENVHEEHFENIFSEYKIIPQSHVVVEENSHTTYRSEAKVIESFSELLDSLLSKNLISHVQRDILAQYKLESHLLKNYDQLLNPKPEMKSFAIALYIMSHKAYDYVFKTYKSTLPPVNAVEDWLVKKNGNTGFTRETLEAINFINKGKGLKSSPFYICLVLKEIKLQKNYRAPSQWTLKLMGNTKNPLDWSLSSANSVLVLTAVAINASWKLPIGYFWDNVVNGFEQANLVKAAISILETVGAVPVAISFEGNDDNRRMCEELSGSYSPTVKEYFMSNSGVPIFMFPDPCDILDLIYKDIKDIECYDKSHRVVSLKHLPELIKYANIPSEQPISLKKVIASKLCRKDFRSYKGSGAGNLTFLEHLQNVFDVLFSRHSAQAVQKPIDAAPIDTREAEVHRIAVILREARTYMKSLKFNDSQALDRFSSLKMLNTLISTTLMMIYKYWRQWSIPFGQFIGNSSYFLANLTPKCNGNKNPTANTFQREYKAMLQDNFLKPMLIKKDTSKKIIENFLVLKCKNPVDAINLTTAIPNGNKLKIIAHDFWKLMRSETNEFTDEFIVYVSRFVTSILIYQLHCETCIGAIRSQNANTREMQTRPEHRNVKKKLVVTKLEEPSNDVMDICNKSEAVFKTAVLHRRVNVKLCVPVLVSKVLKKYLNRPLFEDLLHHQFETDRSCNHLIELTKAVANSYLSLRISHWKRNVQMKVNI